jgi:hypothetical protein
LSGRSERKDRADERRWRVVRRLRGLALDNQGESWLVGFEINGKLVEYELPAARLSKRGIKMRHQPFEMDEVVSADPGVEDKGYRFRPLAGPNESFVEELRLDPERQRLRDLIFAKFGRGSRFHAQRFNRAGFFPTIAGSRPASASRSASMPKA